MRGVIFALLLRAGFSAGGLLISVMSVCSRFMHREIEASIQERRKPCALVISPAHCGTAQCAASKNFRSSGNFSEVLWFTRCSPSGVVPDRVGLVGLSMHAFPDSSDWRRASARTAEGSSHAWAVQPSRGEDDDDAQLPLLLSRSGRLCPGRRYHCRRYG